MLERSVVIAVLLGVGCGGPPDAFDAGTDAGAAQDAGAIDAGSTDAAFPPDAGMGRRALLVHDFHDVVPIPTWVSDNLASLDALPFDGVAIYMRQPDVTDNVSATVMQATPLDPSAVADVLAPMPAILAGGLPDCLVLVLNNRPGDLFDDAAWAIAVANFGVLAAALRDAGVPGVFFDNEEYAERWGDYDPTSGHTLDESYARARLRGRQVMEAMVAEYPDIHVLTLHGPYIAEPDAPIPPFEGPYYDYNENLGAFFAGFVEGAGDRARVIDGGEIYTLRAEADFAATYDWRKYTIASETVDSAFIPAALRPLWPERVDISFGLFDLPFRGVDMTPAIMETTVANALLTTDYYVWINVEGPTFLAPPSAGGADPAWIAAIAAARDSTGL